MPTQPLNKPKKRKKYKLGKGPREVYELVKSHWPVSTAEIIDLKNYKGSTQSGRNRFLYNLKVLKKEGLIELKRSGPRIYIAWPKDIEKLRDDELRNGLLGLLEAVSQAVYNKMKERPRARQ